MTALAPAVEQNGEPQAAQPADLIQLAIEKGMDADAITKLVDLIERREKAAAERAYTDAKRSVEYEVEPILRNVENASSKKYYADLEAVNRAVKPIYTKHGFSVTFAEADSPLPGWKRTICDVRHRGGHKERYHLDLPLDGMGAKGNAIGQMNPVQAAVSTGTYGQRVLLCRVFNLTITDSDTDGNAPSEPITDEQAQDLEALWTEFAELHPKSKLDAFLRTFGGDGCESILAFSEHQCREAAADLKRRIAKAKGGAK